MAIEGADVRALRALAHKFDLSAQTLETLRSQLGPASPVSAWSGPDADSFRHAWSSHVGPSLHSVALGLQQAAKQLRTNADAQERTSATLGGATAGAGSAGAGASGAGASGASGTGGTGDSGNASVSVSASGSAGEKVSLPHEGSLYFGLLGGATLTRSATSAHGFTTYTTTSDVSAGVKASAGVKGLDVSGTYVRGSTSQYEVTVPVGTDVRGIDPTDPSTMPTGTAVTVKGGHYVDQSGDVNYRGAAAEGDTKYSDNTSTSVVKTGDHTVRILAGPTQSMEQYLGLGADLSALKVMLGGTHTVDYGSYRSADLDLSTPAGAAAYQQYVEHGTFPAAPTDGVSGTTKVDSLDSTGASAIGIETPFGKADVPLGASDGHIVQTTQPDGTSKVDYSFHDDAVGTSKITVPFDAHGHELTQQRTYTYDVKADTVTAGLLDGKWGFGASDQHIHPGDDVQIHLTESQMSTLLDNAHRAAAANPGSEVSAYSHDYGARQMQTEPVTSPFTLGVELATNPGSPARLASVLWSIGDGADGKVDSSLTRFPGTVTVKR